MKVDLIGVSKVFGKVRALNQIQLELAPGKIYAILGANGAGKSTLLQILAGCWLRKKV
jgi:ABC-type sugar transport system ATPase subunit